MTSHAAAPPRLLPPNAEPAAARLRRAGALTPGQERTARSWDAPPDSAMPAAFGSDVFLYVDEGETTLRLQVDAAGDVVGHVRLRREGAGAAA